MLLLDGRSSAYQWDANLYLIIPGGKVGDDIHFGRNKTAAVVRAESRDGRIVAVVPNIELQTDGEIDVYRYIYDAKGNRTIWADKLTVQPRERPDDYVYTETPVKTWNELDSRIKALEQTVAAELPVKVAPPDWNQNDPTAVDYVKNRPFYDGNMVIVDGTFDFLAEEDVYAAKLRDISGVFSESEKYVVNFDGTDYSVSYSDDGFGDWLSTCPIQIRPYQGELFAMTNSGGSHSVSLKGRYKELLPEKYLPSTAAQVMNITYAPSYDELVAARKHYYNGGILTILGDIVTNILGDITDEDGISLTIESGTYTFTASDDHTITMQHYYRLTKAPTDGYAPTAIYLRSDTSNSKKQFKITVDDSGTLTATEVT